MTWSLLARDADGRFGAIVASRFFAVGALCIHTRRGVGAVATQALMNPLYGPAALDALAAGRSAADAVAALTAADAGRSQRQLLVLGTQGAPAVHTGADCVDWCGQVLQDDFCTAGNMLAGAAVLRATAEAFAAAAAQSRPLAERLILAMQAGQAAGGDKRGQQSAALRVQADEDRAELDLRVDDHEQPLQELQRLYQVSLQRFQPFVACLAGRHDPVGETDRSRIEARIQQFTAALPPDPDHQPPEPDR
ncbi:MAG: DUF1028 domain-containing protein [Rubrivivax sp.]